MKQSIAEDIIQAAVFAAYAAGKDCGHSHTGFMQGLE